MKIGKKYIEDYKDYLFNRVLPLVGLSSATLVDDENCKGFKDYVVFDKENSKIIFGTAMESICSINSSNAINEEENDVGLLKTVIRNYNKVSRFDYNDKIAIGYLSNEMFHNASDYSLQKSIADWISGSNSTNTNVELLLNELDNWKLKTYEGKSVTFNFKIINSDNSPVMDFSDFLSFIKKDYSAVLSDPTASLFILNSNCEYLGYKSIFNCSNKNKGYDLGKNVPYRFSDIIHKEIIDKNTIGISLLSNGDIIVSKNKSVKMVKRGNKWLNFNGIAFKNIIISHGINISLDLLDEIYATALDVSFSHCGGIISCIDYRKFQNDPNKAVNGKRPILSDEDNLIIKNNQKNIKKHMIYSLVGKKKFIKIDRKLRAELSALDGACILDMSGNVIAFGAIIQNESGSTGGGRGAAARRLSTFGGFAIKISTDGYLELYIDGGEPVYTIK